MARSINILESVERKNVKKKKDEEMCSPTEENE